MGMFIHLFGDASCPLRNGVPDGCGLVHNGVHQVLSYSKHLTRTYLLR